MAKKRKVTRRRPRVSGLNSKNLTGVAISAVLGGAGAVFVGMVLDKVLPAKYAQYSHYAKIAGGVALAAMSNNPYMQTAGLGAATVGAAAVVGDLTDGQPAIPGLNLLPPGVPSRYLAGIGNGGGVITQ